MSEEVVHASQVFVEKTARSIVTEEVAKLKAEILKADEVLVGLLSVPVEVMTEDEKNLVIQRCAEILGGKK